MKLRHLVPAALLCSAAVPVCAQDFTAQQLLDKNLEARGGADSLASIKSLRFEGKMIFPGDVEVEYKEMRAKIGSADADRVDLTLQGLSLIQSYDGRGAWRINPLQGRRDPEKMSADEARSMADSALIGGVLQSSRRDGSTIDYLGREDFEGTSAYKLKVRQKDGDEFTYLLDPDTFLEIKITEMRRIRGAQQTSETELGDYEKAGGVYFPMSVESWQQGQPNQRQRVIIATAIANPPVDPAIFAEPGGPGQPAKASPEPPDASNKNQQPEQKDAPAEPPSNPPQSPEGE